MRSKVSSLLPQACFFIKKKSLFKIFPLLCVRSGFALFLSLLHSLKSKFSDLSGGKGMQEIYKMDYLPEMEGK